VLEVLLGFLTFTGSVIAAAKLQEVKWIPQRPWVYKGQNVVNLIAFGVAVVRGVLLVLQPDGGLRAVHLLRGSCSWRSTSAGCW
jgi:NAD(P) transhydrogenase subunit beta